MSTSGTSKRSAPSSWSSETMTSLVTMPVAGLGKFVSALYWLCVQVPEAVSEGRSAIHACRYSTAARVRCSTDRRRSTFCRSAPARKSPSPAPRDTDATATTAARSCRLT